MSEFNFGTESAEKYLYGTQSLAFMLANPTIHLIFFWEVSRLWLISFNLHHLNSSKNEKWKSQIDTNIANNDWYIKNKNTFGNQKKVIIAAGFWWLITVTLIDIGYYVNYDLGTVVGAFFMFLSVVAAFYIYYQCRNYYTLQDNLLFYYEFRATIIIWGISFVLFFVAEIIRMMDGGPVTLTISLSINGYCSIFALCAPSLLSTIWIPHKFTVRNKQMRDIFIMIKSKSIDEDSVTGNQEPNDKKLFETLKDEQKFEKFIQFMFRDFSSEAMLGYIEMVQFKERFVKEINYKEETSCDYMNSLYDNVPKSSIVYDAKDDTKGIERMKKVAHSLCDKYISVNSEFEVNIAWKLRKKVILLADTNWDMEIKDFICVFDRVLYDLFAFMKQSFERFLCHD